ncbi:MAG: hypothetical protein ACK4WH_05775 [Phycisphaerales bacterium]
MSAPASELTWASLLAHWTAFAQSSLALPKSAEGQRWKDAVPAIIGLQAISHALAEIDTLSPVADRGVAIGLATVGIQTHAGTLRSLWKDQPLHPELSALIADATAAISAAKGAGVEWTVTADRLVVDHPAELVESLLRAGFSGDLYLPVPGSALFRHSPAAFCRERTGAPPGPEVTGLVRQYLNAGATEGGVAKHVRARVMRQVYRQFDFGLGRAVRDLVVPADGPPPGGQPQLVPAIIDGKSREVTLPIRGMADLEALQVEFSDRSSRI